MNLLQCTSHAPWKAEFGRSGWCVLSARGEGVAYVRQDMIHDESNARLIASAPELLAIVRALLPHASNEWTRLDDLAHRGNRESEDSAMQLDRLIEHARETIEEIIGDNE